MGQNKVSTQKHKMFIVKRHQTEPTNTIISIIDKNLFGGKIVEGNKILDLTSEFYKGEVKTKEEVLKIILKANHINVVGKEIIKLLKERELVDQVLTIDGCPYAQILLV